MTDRQLKQPPISIPSLALGLALCLAAVGATRAQVPTGADTTASSEAMVAPLVRTKPKPVTLKADIRAPDPKSKTNKAPVTKSAASSKAKPAIKTAAPQTTTKAVGTSAAGTIKSGGTVAPNGLKCNPGLTYDAKSTKCVKAKAAASSAKTSSGPKQ